MKLVTYVVRARLERRQSFFVMIGLDGLGIDVLVVHPKLGVS